jgi:hypothetical protein
VYVPTFGLERAVLKWWSRWVLRGRKARPEYLLDGGLSLKYTARYHMTAAVSFAAVTGVYGLGFYDGTIFTARTLQGIALIAGSVAIWVLFGAFFVSSWIEHVVIMPTQLRRRSWRGRQEIGWGDVSFVRIDHVNAGVQIGVQGGTVIHVSFYLDGLSAVADALQRHSSVPPGFLAAALPDRTVPFT